MSEITSQNFADLVNRKSNAAACLLQHQHAVEAFYIAGYTLEILLKSLYLTVDLDYPKTHNYSDLNENYLRHKKLNPKLQSKLLESSLQRKCLLLVQTSIVSKKKWAPELRYSDSFCLSASESDELQNELKSISKLSFQLKHSFRGRNQ